MKLYTRHNCLTGYNEAIPEDIIAAFNDLPLTTRMRTAASVLIVFGGEFDARESSTWPGYGASPADLCRMADKWEREDAEKAQEAAEVEELAQLIGEHVYGDKTAVFTGGRELARAVLGAGYRKQADDDRP